MALKLPIQSSKRDGSTMNGKSQSSLDDDRSKMSAAFSQLIADISQGLQSAGSEIYPDENDCIEVKLPHRTLLDFAAIDFLHLRGVISDDVAREEYINVVGIASHRTDKRVKLIPGGVIK